MELKTVSIDQIVPYDNNPRHNDKAVSAVAESIKECGYSAPIVVDENMVVLAGHTRLKALKEIGTEQIEVMVCTGMSESQKKKYRVLDNKTAELSVWNFDALRVEAEGLDFSYDFGIDDLLSKGDNLKMTAEKNKKKEKHGKICTCPRCNCQWEE